MSEIHENEVQRAVLAVFPDAELAADEDGQLVVNTGCMWSGKNGEFVLGNMVIVDDEDDDDPDPVTGGMNAEELKEHNRMMDCDPQYRAAVHYERN